MFEVCFLWRTPPPLQESNSPDLWPIQRGRSDQGSTEKEKISSALRLKRWPQAEIVYCITCQRDWALLEFLTDYFYIHRKDAGSLVPPHAQSLQFPQKMTKKVRRRAHDAPRRAWLALATQPVCGHAGAPEQPSAPDEHVSTQTYRKQHSLCLSPFSHLDDVKPELNNKLLSTIALKREFEASELIWGVTSRVRGVLGVGTLHRINPTLGLRWQQGGLVRRLMCVSRYFPHGCRQSGRQAVPAVFWKQSATLCTASDHWDLTHNLASNE